MRLSIFSCIHLDFLSGKFLDLAFASFSVTLFVFFILTSKRILHILVTNYLSFVSFTNNFSKPVTWLLILFSYVNILNSNKVKSIKLLILDMLLAPRLKSPSYFQGREGISLHFPQIFWSFSFYISVFKYPGIYFSIGLK